MKPAMLLGLLPILFLEGVRVNAEQPSIHITRQDSNPIITTTSSPSLGNNVNGPSLIRVPDWVDAPLGRYYLYFAHHKGKHIRLAYADAVTGPWHIYEPGTLQLDASGFPTGIIGTDTLPVPVRERVEKMRAAGDDPLYTHIASPEVLVVPEEKQIRLYYHGMQANGSQASRVAVSSDGLHFRALPEVITGPYLRVFRWHDQFYGLAMPGVFYRSRDGLQDFKEGVTLFNKHMRHSALMIRGNTLYVFWTQVGDAPEHVLLSTIDIGGDWSTWKATAPIEILRPETEWEGASLPIGPSGRGAVEIPVNQLRDPGIFEEDGKTWLLYAIAGEQGLAIALLTEQ